MQSRSVKTLRSLIERLNADDRRDRDLYVPSATMTAIKTRLTKRQEPQSAKTAPLPGGGRLARSTGVGGRTGQHATPTRRASPRNAHRLASAAPTSRPTTPPLTKQRLDGTLMPAYATFDIATEEQAHQSRSARRPSTMPSPLPVRAIHKPVHGVYVNPMSTVKYASHRGSTQLLTPPRESSTVTNYMAEVEAQLASKRKARMGATRTANARRDERAASSPDIRGRGRGAAMSGSADNKHLARSGPGMISGTVIVSHDHIQSATNLAKRVSHACHVTACVPHASFSL